MSGCTGWAAAIEGEADEEDEGGVRGQTLKKRFLSLFWSLFLHDAAPQLALPLPPRPATAKAANACRMLHLISFAPALKSPWTAMK